MKIGPVDVEWIVDNRERIGELLLEHIYLSAIGIVIGIVISLALTLLIRRSPRLFGPIIGITGTLYAIPSLALFALLTPLTGVGTTLTAEIALVSYTLLILTRNFVAGLNAVPADAIEAAAGMGYTPLQRLLRVELPLALPVMVAGVRIAAVTTIGLVTVTALIGLGGLGYLIVTIGMSRGSFGLTAALTGVVLAVALAVVVDLVLLAIQRALTPWSRGRGAA